MANELIPVTKIAVFRNKEIRKTIHKNEWWFCISDVVEALTDTPNSSDYIKKMRKRDVELGKGWGQIVTPLSVQAAGGAMKSLQKVWTICPYPFLRPNSLELSFGQWGSSKRSGEASESDYQEQLSSKNTKKA